MEELPCKFQREFFLEIGKTDNGNVIVTSHLMGVRSHLLKKIEQEKRINDKARLGFIWA
ncbi:hypothetical protein [Geminocystis sp. NIES-3709]|uniref:hypothetical protein n=1 Tax=Geminocystis sp. NIES-3709 TaxID=1617448 RepID=UPI0005FCB85B|nr:hypothetical protein [Geminocystis sp. NIES-3709]BAQ64309.1 hypothetical protein GM3709_1074 [Geminocystis sp. NIES-3709]